SRFVSLLAIVTLVPLTFGACQADETPGDDEFSGEGPTGGDGDITLGDGDGDGDIDLGEFPMGMGGTDGAPTAPGPYMLPAGFTQADLGGFLVGEEISDTTVI